MLEALGRPRALALTATAAPPVRREITERLGLRDPTVVVRGFDRPNISLAVERFSDADAKDAALVERVGAGDDRSGIVYAATRARTEALAERLAGAGVAAVAYHQELGRAGRDGRPAEAVLFFRPEDLGLRRFFAGGGRLGADQLERVARALEGGGISSGRPSCVGPPASPGPS
jgi:ATP-dependent DNA helicase RecQ